MQVDILRREMLVPRPLAEVFPFFARPENLAELTPPFMGFQVLTPGPLEMTQGAVIDYVIRLAGLPVRWTTLIAVYEPPHRFVDIQLRGPYSFWHHTHTFTPVEGGTSIRDEVRYLLPLGPLGRLARTLLVRRQLETIFAYRTEVIRRRFGG